MPIPEPPTLPRGQLVLISVRLFVDFYFSPCQSLT
jgi:hypothetical protein